MQFMRRILLFRRLVKEEAARVRISVGRPKRPLKRGTVIEKWVAFSQQVWDRFGVKIKRLLRVIRNLLNIGKAACASSSESRYKILLANRLSACPNGKHD